MKAPLLYILHQTFKDLETDAALYVPISNIFRELISSELSLSINDG